MISTLLLAAMSAGAPVEARVTAVDLQRPVGVADTWYNRVSIELESAEERRIRLCPSDLAVVTQRRVGDGFARVDRFRSHAMRMADARDQTGSCRQTVLAPGRPQAVTFIVSAVPGGRHRGEDRYRLVLDADWSRSSMFGPAPIPAP